MRDTVREMLIREMIAREINSLEIRQFHLTKPPQKKENQIQTVNVSYTALIHRNFQQQKNQGVVVPYAGQQTQQPYQQVSTQRAYHGDGPVLKGKLERWLLYSENTSPGQIQKKERVDMATRQRCLFRPGLVPCDPGGDHRKKTRDLVAYQLYFKRMD